MTVLEKASPNLTATITSINQVGLLIVEFSSPIIVTADYEDFNNSVLNITINGYSNVNYGRLLQDLPVIQALSDNKLQKNFTWRIISIY